MTFDETAVVLPAPVEMAPVEMAPAETAPAETAPAERVAGDFGPRPERRPVPFAFIAFGIAIILLIAEGVAVYLASTGSPVAATLIAQILIGATLVPFGLGFFAVVRGPRRRWAIAAMIVAVIANPLILLHVLSFFGSL